MKVILKADIQNVGKAGQIIKVKDGFARNFLFPKKLAQEATEKRVKELQHLIDVAQLKQKKLLKEKQELLDKIAQTHLVIHVTVGESDKLFGAITNTDIMKALKEKNLIVDRKNIHIEAPIRQLGQHKALISLGENMRTELQFFVEKKDTHQDHHEDHQQKDSTDHKNIDDDIE